MTRKRDLEKMTCKCLRCGQRHTNTVDWYVSKKHRNCPACGGEMDIKTAFPEQMKRWMAEIDNLRSARR